MSDTKVFILTVEAIQNYEGVVIPLPKPLCYFGRGADTDEAMDNIAETFQEEAEKLGANAVLGVTYSKPDKYDTGKWWIYATGTPVILDPPLTDPDEYRENMKDHDLREV